MTLNFQKLIVFLTIIFVSSCGGIKVINKDFSDLYSKEFLATINKIKADYRDGKEEEALKSLQTMNEQELESVEKAMRRNLIGVIYFGRAQYEQSIYNFELALAHSREDESLNAQLFLNLASSYYKLGVMDKAFEALESGQAIYLGERDYQNFYMLRYKVSKELSNDREEITSLIFYLKDRETLNELKSDPLFENLTSSYFKLEKRSRLRIIDEFENKKFLSVGYLAYIEAEKMYYSGERDEAIDLLEWLTSRYEGNKEIDLIVSGFRYRIQNFSKIKTNAIGILLPLSGSKKSFGERALIGIDNALRDLDMEGKFEIFVRDTEGSGAVGGYRVRELIEKNFVSVIIGGLFSAEATKEYLEAKKHGAFFISLSQVYLPKEQKDHLLLEVPGSVESQIDKLFSTAMLEKFGNKGAIIYPESERGQAFVDEFWRKSQLRSVKVVNALSYDKTKTDHRETIRNILGLGFPRERQEEFDLYKEIYDLEKSSSIRRLQTLKPQIDFDWIFMPSYPSESLQLIPSFSYYDAFDLKLIGGLSWRSNTLFKESYKLGTLHFIGEDVSAEENKAFTQSFITRYKRRPRLIEVRAYDAFKVFFTLLKDQDFNTRDEMDIFIRSNQSLTGITGNWRLDEGIWLKDMASLELKRGKINKLIN